MHIDGDIHESESDLILDCPGCDRKYVVTISKLTNLPRE